MLEQSFELRLSNPIADVFAALAAVVSVGRWDSLIDADTQRSVPRRGCRYCTLRRGRVCRGQVIECLRPVSLIVSESLHRSPSHVQLRMKWRIEPLSSGTLLVHDVKATLNRAAALKRRNWERKLQSDGARLFAQIADRLQACETDHPPATVIGQSIGSKNIVSTKITSVSGKPILR
jgi:hypothetical protein